MALPEVPPVKRENLIALVLREMPVCCDTDQHSHSVPCDCRPCYKQQPIVAIQSRRKARWWTHRFLQQTPSGVAVSCHAVSPVVRGRTTREVAETACAQ